MKLSLGNINESVCIAFVSLNNLFMYTYSIATSIVLTTLKTTKKMITLLRSNSYHLVGRVVRLELLMIRVLHVDGVVSDDRGDRRVVAHHRLCALFTVKLQKGLQREHRINTLQHHVVNVKHF